VKSLKALVVAALLAGVFAPRWLPRSERPSCCCPDGMFGACSRMATGCSLKQCPPEDSAAISVSTARIVLPSAPALPVPSDAGLLGFLDVAASASLPDDPSDPPPRG